MPKSFFTAGEKKKLIGRFEKISPNANALWGQLSVSDMLFHVRKVNEAILVGTSTAAATLKQRSLKILVLYVMRKLPKGIKSGTAYLPTTSTRFGNELLELFQSMDNLSKTTKAISGQHPVFGPLEKTEWGYFLWIHHDHHLRQFGG